MTKHHLIFLLAALSGCGDNELPMPDVPALPACAELGCAELASSDKQCAATGACTCAVDRTAPIACAVGCADLPCDDVACEPTDVGPDACACSIGGTWAACRP